MNLKNKFYLSLILSFVVHLIFASGINFSQMFSKKNQQASVPQITEIEILQNNKNAQQIVEQDKHQVNDEVPSNTRFLSQHNQKIVEQTKARHNGTYNNNAGQMGKQQQAQKQIGKNTNQQKHQQKSKLLPASRNKNGLPTLAALKPQFDWQPEPLGKSGRAGDVSRNNDHLKDIKDGNQTLLSTKEFVYYTYYNRIRRKLRDYWEPSIKDKVRKLFYSGRRLASTQERITKVLIHLDKTGTLIRVQVIGESGIHDLDQAAVEAFRSAAPFPNPPAGIVDPDGTVKIRWDFILEA